MSCSCVPIKFAYFYYAFCLRLPGENVTSSPNQI